MSNHSPYAMSCWTRYWTITVIVGLVVMNSLFVASTPIARAAGDVGYMGPAFADQMGSPSTSKPQSKLWWNDGFWWASMWDIASSRFRIFKLDLATQTWINTGTDLDTRSKSTRADTLWDDKNKKLYVASHKETETTGPGATTSERGQLWRFSYTASTDTYTLDTGFPVKINDAKSETLVIDKDSTGRLWATWVQQTTATSGVYKVYVNRTTGNDASWGTPFELPVSNTTVAKDDISSLVAFGGNKIGVMWSNQQTKKMFFAVHLDADADNVWQPEQTALPGPNHCKTGEACADDHINLASLQEDGSGRVYAAIKTSLTALNAPQVMLLVRGTDGNWTSNVFGTVEDDHTRPIVMLDTTNKRIHMFATLDTPGSTTGGSIYEKSTSINSPSFAQGLGIPFIEEAATPGRDGRLNNATSTKQNVNCTTGLVVLATNTNTDRYWHNFKQIPGCATGTNLLGNGGFELDANGDGRPDNWTSTSRFTRSNAIAPHGGSYVGRHYTTADSSYTVSQKVSATAGASYTFSGWVNIPQFTDSTGFTFKVQVRWLDSAGSSLGTKTIKSYTAATNGWVQATPTSGSLVAPTGTVSAQVRMNFSSLMGTVYVDDFSMTQ
jgi:hypothetical protein